MGIRGAQQRATTRTAWGGGTQIGVLRFPICRTYGNEQVTISQWEENR
jgi:hypothetical protein